MRGAVTTKPDPVTVFILDDDESVCTALARLVRSAGMVAVCVATPEEIAQTVNPRSRACVIADIRMPDLDGLSVPHLLRQQGCDLPVIFVTAQDTAQTRSAAKRAGAAGFFRKPVDDSALLDAIEWSLRDESNHAQP